MLNQPFYRLLSNISFDSLSYNKWQCKDQDILSKENSDFITQFSSFFMFLP